MPKGMQGFQKGHKLGVGRPVSPETRQKLSKIFKGKKLSDEQKKKISAYTMGHPVSNETKERISKANTGKKRSKEFCIKLGIIKKGHKKYDDAYSFLNGEENPFWKGKDVGYSSLHMWVNRHKNKPIECIECGEIKKLDWANIDHKYRRVLDDYIALCRKCHKRFDKKMKVGEYAF